MSTRWKWAIGIICVVWVMVLVEVVNTSSAGEPGGFALILRDFGEMTPGGFLRLIAVTAAIVFALKKRAVLRGWHEALLDKVRPA